MTSYESRRYLRVPHDSVPNRGFFRFFVEVISNANYLLLEVFRPIAIFYIVIILLWVFEPETIENSQRVLHVIMKVFANKIVKRFDAVVEYSHIVDRSAIRWQFWLVNNIQKS